MTPEAKAAALSRCDVEIARIEKEGETGEYPAWLIALGKNDWEMEKMMLNKNGQQPGEVEKPDGTTGSGDGGESQTLAEPSGLGCGAQTAQGAIPLCPVQILNDLADSCSRMEDDAFWILTSAAAHCNGHDLNDGEPSSAETLFRKAAKRATEHEDANA